MPPNGVVEDTSNYTIVFKFWDNVKLVAQRVDTLLVSLGLYETKPCCLSCFCGPQQRRSLITCVSDLLISSVPYHAHDFGLQQVHDDEVLHQKLPLAVGRRHLVAVMCVTMYKTKGISYDLFSSVHC